MHTLKGLIKTVDSRLFFERRNNRVFPAGPGPALTSRFYKKIVIKKNGEPEEVFKKKKKHG